MILGSQAWALARSAAAMLLGYMLFDPGLRVAGVVCNRVGGESHTLWIGDALAADPRLANVAFLGGLPKANGVAIEERYLGLSMPHEAVAASAERVAKLAVLVESHLDVDAVLRLAQAATTTPVASSPPGVTTPDTAAAVGAAVGTATATAAAAAAARQRQPASPTSLLLPGLPPTPEMPQSLLLQLPPPPLATAAAAPRCRIGVVRDHAFCFYYQDNLHLLAQAGAELVVVSALSDPELPADLDGLYIGGGYPELYAKELAANASFRASVRAFCERGGAVLAECGGLVYLGSHLWTKELQRFAMCGVFEFSTRMTRHMKMGYVEARPTRANPHFPAGAVCRGQLYHFSEVVLPPSPTAPSTTLDGATMDATAGSKQAGAPFEFTMQMASAGGLASVAEPAGYVVNNTVASYCHTHWGGSPIWAESFVSSAVAAGAALRCDIVANADAPTAGDAAALVPHPRVVSFVPVATGIVRALGGHACLVGVTDLCDPEPGIAPPPVLCRSAIDASTMSSEEVETAMAAIKARGSSAPGLWLIDVGALRRAAPTVALVQTTCDVCDPAADDVLLALQQAGLGECCNTVKVGPSTLEQVFDAVTEIGAIIGRYTAAAVLVDSLRERLQRVKMMLPLTSADADPPLAPPRVLSLEGLSPPCTGGHWLPDIKVAAGAQDALGDLGGCPARRISWDEIAAADPDVLILCPCGASVERTLAELDLLAVEPQFWSLRAIRRPDSVFIVDHELYSRPGPALVAGTEQLAALIHTAPRRSQHDSTAAAAAIGGTRCLRLPSTVERCTGEELAAYFFPLDDVRDNAEAPTVPPTAAVDKNEVRGNDDTGGDGGGDAMSTAMRTLANRELPVTIDDLEPPARERALKSTLPHAMAKALHRRCVQLGRDCYVDPDSGYSVFSRVQLARRPCCGNGCRHCPHGHRNVPAATRARLLQDW